MSIFVGIRSVSRARSAQARKTAAVSNRELFRNRIFIVYTPAFSKGHRNRTRRQRNPTTTRAVLAASGRPGGRKPGRPSMQLPSGARRIPRVISTLLTPSPGSAPPSQSLKMARICPFDGSVTTAIGSEPLRVTVAVPSGPVRTIRSSVSAHSGSYGTRKTKPPPPYSIGVGRERQRELGLPVHADPVHAVRPIGLGKRRRPGDDECRIEGDFPVQNLTPNHEHLAGRVEGGRGRRVDVPAVSTQPVARREVEVVVADPDRVTVRHHVHIFARVLQRVAEEVVPPDPDTSIAVGEVGVGATGTTTQGAWRRFRLWPTSWVWVSARLTPMDAGTPK